MAENDQNVVTLEELEKSWNDSKAALRELLGVESDDSEDLEKASSDDDQETLEKGGDKAEDADDDDEDDEDEEEDMDKSLEDFVGEDEEAAAAMDVEPFLRQLVKAIDMKFEAIQKSISQDQKNTKTLAKALGEIGNQQMLIANTVEAIGGQPIKSTSVLRKAKDRFEGQNAPTTTDLSPDQVMTKALKMSQDNRIPSRMVTIVQNRLNKNLPLPDDFVKALQEAE